MEAAFLGKKAGFETVVVDRKETAPALSICDEPHVLNPLDDPAEAKGIFESCDAVIPACEELDLLEALDSSLSGTSVPFLFDLKSYGVSCSKRRSNDVMASVGVPLPQPWPECGFPVIVKPSSQSGSIGVSVAFNQQDVEVIGNGETARSFVTTEVVLDHNYDCKMVRCFPDLLSPEEDELFGRIGRDVAEAIGLNALMDVEAIDTPKGLRVLEIDARIPSQTPAAIWTGAGINLLEELVASRTGKETGRKNSGRSGIYWHLYQQDGVLRTSGEKEFGHVRNPRMERGLFGSDDSITDYEPGRRDWHGTFMVSGDTPEEAEARRESVINRIIEECQVDTFIDGAPDVI